MATFVLYVDTPTWEFHYDPEHRSYHFEGRCAVRVFIFLGRPFAYPVPSYRFSPTSPYGDEMVFEQARPHDEQMLRSYPASSAVHGFPEYNPQTRYSETDPSEDPPTHAYSESSAPTPPRVREGSEETVVQPRLARRSSMRPQPGASRVPPSEEARQWIGFLPPFPGQWP